MLGHAKEIVTADNYIDNHEIIADGVSELQEYMQDVLPKEKSDCFEDKQNDNKSDLDLLKFFDEIVA